jgi:hypothetical protein
MLTREDDVDARALRRMTTRSASKPTQWSARNWPRELVLKADFAAAVAAIFYALIEPV